MAKGFAKVEWYDENKELTSKEKLEVWADFLSSYGQDNPYSTEDDGLRNKAEQRLRHWKSYKVASLPQKPSYTRPSSTSNVTERDGTYITYANGIAKDTSTGLEWKVGPDRDTDWNEARSWAEDLNLDGGGWRMPTIYELRGLFKKGAGSRNITPLFKTTGWWVWTGKTKGSSDAWIFNFYGGHWTWSPRNAPRGSRAFAVRSRAHGLKSTPDKTIKGKLFVQTTPTNSRVRILNIKPKFYQGMDLDSGSYHVEVSKPDYKTKKMWVKLESGESKQLKIRLEQLQASIQPTTAYTRPSSSTSYVIEQDGIYAAYSNGIVKNTVTGLEWVAGPDRDMNREMAKNWAKKLNLDGGGWRLPTPKELMAFFTTKSNPLYPATNFSGKDLHAVSAKHPKLIFLFDKYGIMHPTNIDTNLDGKNSRAVAVRSRSDG